MKRRIALIGALIVLAAGLAVGLAITRAGSARAAVPANTMAVGDAAAVEGSPGTFTVTLNRRLPAAFYVYWYTSDGTATAPSDYPAQSGSFLFPAWQYTATFNVNTNVESGFESTENFFVHIYNGNNVFVTRSTGTFTLYDAPVVNVSNAAAGSEGLPLTYTFTLSHSLPVTASATYVVWQDFTHGAIPWVAGTDYTSPGPSTTVTFAPGVTSQTVTFSTKIDAEGTRDNCGGSQDVWLHMKSATNAVLPYPTTPEVGSPPGTWSDFTNNGDLTDNWGLGTVPGYCVPTVNISNAPTVSEGGDLTFTFTLTSPSPNTVSTTWQLWTSNTPWVAGSDYAMPYPLTTVTFLPGQTSKTVTYHTLADCTAYYDVTAAGSQEVWLLLLSATNANLPVTVYTNPADLTDRWGLGLVNGTNAGPCP